MLRRSIIGWLLCPTLVPVAADVRAQAEAGAAARLAAAERLLHSLELANTSYAHGPGRITWSGTVVVHTDCSGFIDHLLMHVHGHTPDDFKRWMGSRRPTARRYHDAIEQGRGFITLQTVAELQPGDLIAIKYLTRHDNTGHLMLVAEPPQRRDATAPVVAGTTQYAVTVIDSSESGHGSTDTRYRRGANGRDHAGLGRGVVRLYADEHDRVVGFAWSTLKASRFVAPHDEHVVLGRFVPGYRP
ncbi:MAG: C40 family peptidase [Ideonella sp.]|nr:C40 family peptidase [Ideonella sp.]MCC7459587.1 C40 family peptidase [Nitrospira sp.]